MVKVNFTKRFTKDVELCKARGWDMNRFTEAFRLLTSAQPLPQNFRDHPLKGNYSGHREFHFGPDHLVIYFWHPSPKGKSTHQSRQTSKEPHREITFVRMGSHSDLFN